MPVLAWTLKNLPPSDLAFICGSDGQPLTKETFGNYFCAACNSAGVLKLAHGVRKISATRAANAGATVAELKALFGWTDDVISHYIPRVQTVCGLPRRRSQNYKNRTNYKLVCPRIKNNSIKTISYTVKKWEWCPEEATR